MLFSSIRLVLFDWAGTTVDFEFCAPTRAFQQRFASRGIELSAAVARGPMGTNKRDHSTQLLHRHELATASCRLRWDGRSMVSDERCDCVGTGHSSVLPAANWAAYNAINPPLITSAAATAAFGSRPPRWPSTMNTGKTAAMNRPWLSVPHS